MVVRQAVGEGRGAAGGIDGVGGGGPQVGAQKPAAAAAVEEEDLRRIAVRRELVRVAGLEFGDDAVGQNRAVAREGGEELDAAGKAGIGGENDARFGEGGGGGLGGSGKAA